MIQKLPARHYRHLVALWLVALAWGVPAGAQAPVAGSAAGAAPATLAEYRIGPGDVLSVVFPLNPEINHEGPVGPDGRFALPFAGQLDVSGLTPLAVETLIATSLRKGGVVDDARPSVTVTRYGASVFVGGEVRNPGAVALSARMNPAQAIISAGGLLDTAKSKRVVIIREGAGGAPVTQIVDLQAYVRRGDAAAAVLLHPRDVVFVPKSSIAEVNLWIEQHINRVLPFNRSLNYQLGAATGVGSLIAP